ncbi:hypothetical protein GF340_04115 [Candidatus Peregrinibacteria bacterium]|nr:hypothetical protein [Candidatus Peregrinibacteria bacterium]
MSKKIIGEGMERGIARVLMFFAGSEVKEYGLNINDFIYLVKTASQNDLIKIGQFIEQMGGKMEKTMLN